MLIIIQVIAIFFISDLVAGYVHWFEDSYFSIHTPIIGPLFIVPNLNHHERPFEFVQKSWWASSWDLCVISSVLLTVSIIYHWCSWQLILFLLISINANQVHKWAHSSRQQCPRIIQFLQKINLLQSPRHHAKHHRYPFRSHYCPITPFVNPLLDSMGFWRGIEWFNQKLFGVTCREFEERKINHI